MKYMVISIFEREIFAQQFDTLEDAHKQMMKELKEEFDKYDYEYDMTWDEIVRKKEYDDCDFGFGTDWAWSNIDDDCNCDWKIVKIK